MTRSVVFETPGELDLRAITCIGVNTKPNSTNPIGFFGTGLKYAVAVLAREGINCTLITGGEIYAFYRKTAKFRDKDFDFVRMKRERMGESRRNVQYSELSYTTEFGKNWKLWQVFRELYSNTLDENGRTYVVDDVDDIIFSPNYTYIIVTSEEFVKEYEDRDRNFLPDGLTVRQETTDIQVLDRPSSHVYYRGMRVYDLDKPAEFTYNFLHGVELTEDRTAKNFWDIKTRIERYILKSDNTDFVQRVVSAPGGTMEAELNFTYHSSEPSETFREAVVVNPKGNSTARSYVKSREPLPTFKNPLDGITRPFRLRGNILKDGDGNHILEFSAGVTDYEMSYMVSLLENDLSDYEMKSWAEDNEYPQNGSLEVADDIPF